MTKELVALLSGTEVGRIRQDEHGKLSLRYEDNWREADNAYPLSLSMPLAKETHDNNVVTPFLWGLLPDNEFVLDRWARKYQVSARNPFALLSHVGEDCAGAVQFVSAERHDAVRSGEDDRIEWLDDRAIAERLRLLKEDHAAWRLPRDTGQFSLAGAQPKTALLFQNEKWGIPSGRIATTHILKPPTGHFDGHAENEHICLMLGRALGLPVATSRVTRFDGEVAIVVERYDRFRSGNEIVRVHQEDMCQALGIMPTRKYQSDGGPGVPTIVELLRTYSSERGEDVATFIDAIAFNWLIAGTDAHAKNYSLLLGPRVRLAPLYDIASILPYEEFDPRKVKLSMKIGGVYPIAEIGIRQWQKLARDVHVHADELLERLRGMAARIPDEVNAARARSREEGLIHPIIDRLVERLAERAEACRRALGEPQT